MEIKGIFETDDQVDVVDRTDGSFHLNQETSFSFPGLKYVGKKPKYNYAEAIAKSMLFYEAQRSGLLPGNQRVKWRKNSALHDGEDNGVDLVGGYYDGAGYVKYGFPQAAMTTILAWGVIRYRRAYDVIDQLQYALDTIKWATDYFIKCHTDTNEFYAQVGDKASDRQFQGAPQDMNPNNYKRRSFKINEQKPGSDLAAETSAALASASIVFQPTDPAYSKQLLQHAEELYEFAFNFRGSYSESIAEAEQSYMSGKKDFKDELVWAAAWLYRRTGSNYYLKAAEKGYREWKMGSLAREFSWNDKKAGIQTLMAEITKKQKYKTHAQWFCQYSGQVRMNEFGVQSHYTAGGLLYISEWGPLRYAANTAFICSILADLGISPNENRNLAESQINYILGSYGKSYQIDFGNNYPLFPYHKSSFCPLPPEPCPRFDDKLPNNFKLVGAVIGGPSADDMFMDQRSNEKQNSVTLDFNAGFQSCTASLLDFYLYGSDYRPHYDSPGTITISEVKLPPPKIIIQEPNENLPPDYPQILRKSLMFFEAQRSGYLTSDNKISWRKDSCVDDGKDIGKDLQGGYYDGFTNVKFGFPLCFSMTLLSWSLIEFPIAYRKSKQYSLTIDAVNWGIQYITKTHVENFEIVAQIGNPATEEWTRPDQIEEERPSYLITRANNGRDFTAEMAASLAATSVLFRELDYNDGPEKPLIMCMRAEWIFENLTLYGDPLLYHESVPAAEPYYKSSGFEDETMWAAFWLYKCSGKKQYLNSIYDTETLPKTFSWDEKWAGVNLLLAIENEDVEQIAPFCDYLLFKAPRTPAGLLYLHSTQPSKYAANAAFILVLAFEYFPNYKNAHKWKDLARNQINYLSGLTTGQSYIVDYGDIWPLQPQHKGSSCPLTESCGLSFKNRNSANLQPLIGALVGGPDENDKFEDLRTNDKQSRVSLDTNAALHVASIALYHLQIQEKLFSNRSSQTQKISLTHLCFLSAFVYLMSLKSSLY